MGKPAKKWDVQKEQIGRLLRYTETLGKIGDRQKMDREAVAFQGFIAGLLTAVRHPEEARLIGQALVHKGKMPLKTQEDMGKACEYIIHGDFDAKHKD